ncbi:MAG: hypothetical protein Q4C73_06635 [Eubacteriales bacterium]|nr:hypothetical protein [Eubacteriales bacterium]
MDGQKKRMKTMINISQKRTFFLWREKVRKCVPKTGKNDIMMSVYKIMVIIMWREAYDIVAAGLHGSWKNVSSPIYKRALSVCEYQPGGQSLCYKRSQPQRIEFYTLNYPKSLGKNWRVEEKLQKELTDIRGCMPERILFLDASEQTLRRRKEQDQTRSREFFDYYISNLMPLKRKWFLERENVDVLNTDDLDLKETAAAVRKWIDRIYKGKSLAIQAGMKI